MTAIRSILPFSLAFFLTISSTASLTVTLDDNYPPYSFRDSSGQSQGILVDLWHLWSQKTGVPVQLEPKAWSEALATMNNGEADVLDTVFKTPARSLHYDFTPPYAGIDTAIFHRNGLAGIVSLSNLKGYLVGIKTGDAGADELIRSGVGVKQFASYEQLIEAAGRGDVLVFCMDVPPAIHFLYKTHLNQEFRQAFIIAHDSFYRAVKKGDAATLSLVARGFAQVTADELSNIENRWLGTPLRRGQEGPTVVVLATAAVVFLALLILFIAFFRRRDSLRRGQLAGTQDRLRQSEEWGKALSEALPDLLFILDESGLILECRPPMPNLRYQGSEGFVGKRLPEILEGEFLTTAVENIGTLKETGNAVLLETELIIGGHPRNYESRIVRLSDGRLLAIVRDVTASRKEWNDDLRRNKLESLELLAGGLAHDFNNILAVIQGFVSLAKGQLATPAIALASLEKSLAATRRAAGLTAQLRVLAHGTEVPRKLLSLLKLAEEAATFALAGSPCRLVIKADAGPWNVEGDPDQLSQTIHNLALNAVQAMPNGGDLTLTFQRQDPDWIALSVTDQGTGIPAAELGKVFDPYFTTKTKGSGIGLSVVHAVVQRHGGWVEVSSVVDQGTTFTVKLKASHGLLETGSEETPPTLSDFHGQRAMVMEDEIDLRALVVTVLSSLGFETVACENGIQGVEAFDEALAQGRPFLLVISDLLIPGGMGGQTMIGILRSRLVDFKALAITGFSVDTADDVKEFAGFDSALGKPFTIEEMRAQIQALLKVP